MKMLSIGALTIASALAGCTAGVVDTGRLPLRTPTGPFGNADVKAIASHYNSSVLWQRDFEKLSGQQLDATGAFQGISQYCAAPRVCSNEGAVMVEGIKVGCSKLVGEPAPFAGIPVGSAVRISGQLASVGEGSLGLRAKDCSIEQSTKR